MSLPLTIPLPNSPLDEHLDFLATPSDSDHLDDMSISPNIAKLLTLGNPSGFSFDSPPINPADVPLPLDFEDSDDDLYEPILSHHVARRQGTSNVPRNGKASEPPSLSESSISLASLQRPVSPILQPQRVDPSLDKPKLGLADRIHGFQLLELISEQTSSALGQFHCDHRSIFSHRVYQVDKIIIAERHLGRFINSIYPGAYSSLTKVDLKLLDQYKIQPVGVYGTHQELVKFLLQIGGIDEEMCVLLLNFLFIILIAIIVAEPTCLRLGRCRTNSLCPFSTPVFISFRLLRMWQMQTAEHLNTTSSTGRRITRGWTLLLQTLRRIGSPSCVI